MRSAPSAKDIRDAEARIKDFIHKTPVLSSETINKLCGASIFFKCENFQKAGAFKSRGAVNSIFSLKSEIQKGVCTHSSGNHAQALARAAKLRNIPAFIVMPENAPKAKVKAVKAYGGRITFCEPRLESRESTLKKIQAETGAEEIHPYNDIRTISGQATAAKELIDEVPGLDMIMTPVGGGGLLSGTALSCKYFGPGISVIGAEPKGADDAWRSFNEGKIIPSNNPDTIADGLLTSLGELTFPIIQNLVSNILTVSEEGIIKAMKLIWERMKIIVEPSAAVPLGAVLEHPEIFRQKRLGIILSGGNLDLDKIPW